MTDILYRFEDTIYLNITNKCPCRCTFCIRNNGDGLGSAENLWFNRDPSLEDIIKAIDSYDFSGYNGEIVFCGYGEPLCALDNLIAAAKHIKEKLGLKIRLNTNGLGDLVNKKPVAHLLKGLVDSVSISLNAPDAKSYDAIVKSAYGEKAFDAMLKFAQSCKGIIPEITFTVVDVISPEDIKKCENIANSLGIPLRVRKYSA